MKLKSSFFLILITSTFFLRVEMRVDFTSKIENLKKSADFAIKANDLEEQIMQQAEQMLNDIKNAEGDLAQLEQVVKENDKRIKQWRNEFQKAIKGVTKEEKKVVKAIEKKAKKREQAIKKEEKRVKKEIKKEEKKRKTEPIPPAPPKKIPAVAPPPPVQPKPVIIEEREEEKPTAPEAMRTPPPDVGGLQKQAPTESKILKFLGAIPGLAQLIKASKGEPVETPK